MLEWFERVGGPGRAITLGVLLFVVAASSYYFGFVHFPEGNNAAIYVVALSVAGLAAALIDNERFMTKAAIVVLSLAIGLSALQLSRGQPPLANDLLAFYLLHGALLIGAIFLGELVPKGAPVAVGRDWIADGMVVAFIAVAAFVIINKGVRLEAFLSGVKVDGNQFKMAGVSGIQGIIGIFLLCIFTFLSRPFKVVLIAAMLILAVLDVKRGEVMRLAIFLACFGAISANFDMATRQMRAVALLIVAALVIFVVGGEVRQGLYDSSFSISNMMRSRMGIEAIDWIYGYVGINVSVLQQYLHAPEAAPGFYPQLLSFVFNTPAAVTGNHSIFGFNAGTALSIFAGNNQTLPTVDYVLYCVLFGFMVALSRRAATPSAMAFMLLQIVLLVFGNQLQLPYYTAGFFGAVAYTMLRRRSI